jgi:hypothetical protein
MSDQQKPTPPQRPSRPPQEWKEFKVWKDDKGHQFILQIKGDRRPQWSSRIGYTNRNGEFTPWSRLDVKYNGDGTFDAGSDIDALYDFLGTIRKEVNETRVRHIQDLLDKEQAERIARESRQANWGKQETRRTGKTARDKAKRNGQNHTPPQG